jgi:hypothetical protein
MAAPTRTFVLSGAVVAAFAIGAALAHVPLRHPSSKQPLRWTNGSNVSFVIGSTGSDDLAPGDHESAVRLAAAAWNAAPGSFARLVENTSPVQQASTDWSSSARHLVLFDENNSSSFFPPGSSTVAITPVWFYASGVITDADVLFNGADFRFTTDDTSGRFDVQDVAVHEFGHLLGFDHSPVAGSSLFPYVTAGLVLHRSLSTDDWMAARSRYPSFDEARVSGRVERVDETPVAFAHVILRDDAGRSAGAVLTDSNGTFQFESVLAGEHTVVVVPLDGPVTSANLTGGPTVDVDFQATVAGTLEVVAGVDQNIGALVVDEDALIALGRPFDPLPLEAVAGATRTHVLRGSSLSPGSLLVASDPDLSITVHGWFNSSVSFSVSVPSNEAPGLVDLSVTNAFGDRAVLPGALEIVPPSPTVNFVAPALASASGGDALVVHGTGFRAGVAVVIGGRIFVDGAVGGCTVLDPTRIALELPAFAPGVHDVVVIDASGVEGRATAALTTGNAPNVTSVFPPAGASSGGTRVVMCGSGFDPGLSVTIGGVVQTLDVVAPDHVEFTTSGGLAGAPLDLVATNPIGTTSATVFEYAPRPDPSIAAVTPPEGAAAGGEWVTIEGEGLRADLEVRFGADAATGQGGTLAELVMVSSATSMAALVPPGSGVVGVVVRDVETGQAAALPAAFTYRSSSKSGGCMGLVDVRGPDAPPLRGLGPVVLVALVCVVQAWRARRRLVFEAQSPRAS